MIKIDKINIDRIDDLNKDFLDNISKVLQKLGSSRKTKVLHNLMVEEMLYIGYGTKDISLKRNVFYGTPYVEGTKLHGLIADITTIIPAVERSEVSKTVGVIHKTDKEITRVKSTVTDTSSLQLIKLDNTKKEAYQSILDKIDYFDLVDVYYYLYIEALTIHGMKGNGKNKLVDAAHAVISSTIKKVLKDSHNEVSDEDKSKFDILLDFIFTRSYSGQSTSTIIGKLNKVYGSENIDFLNSLKPDQFDDIPSLATALTKAGLVNMTSTALISNIKRVIGDGAEKALTGTIDEFIAYIISANYKSTLFDARVINVDAQNLLEELVLNFKKDLIIKK